MEVCSLEPEIYLQRFVEQGSRPHENRALDGSRPVTVSHQPIDGTASALVSVGSTRALASITLLIGVPEISKPAEGDLEVQVKFAPFSSMQSSIGSRKPAERAQSIGATIRDLILRGGVLDLEALCIEKHRYAWGIVLDVVCLNDDGSALDACLLAAVASLKNTHVPETREEPDGSIVSLPPSNDVSSPPATPLSQGSLVALTCGICVGKLITDPAYEEEKASPASLTVVVNHAGKVCGVLKSGSETIGQELVLQCAELCRKRCLSVAPLLLRQQPQVQG
uniref:Ribosomal RNA-processing protein 43 n=1 Tax=Octactis speculum TaxID=3111310 RepID=A0A7S2C546_9STRA|mmetsp:Transcript_31778/g.43045  ORF Transcript_31778/g.43045 Transcript_31778/m.43045 type:complete len:280 (+) Transcript_31778:40-879(+)